MTWLLTANSNLCRIYEYDKHHSEPVLINEISHPENKLKKSEYLTSDKPGHFKSPNATGGAFEPHSDLKKSEYEQFAIEIANYLDLARSKLLYKQIYLVTTPEMLGLLRKHLSKEVEKLIQQTIQKDIMFLKPKELSTFMESYT